MMNYPILHILMFERKEALINTWRTKVNILMMRYQMYSQNGKCLIYHYKFQNTTINAFNIKRLSWPIT